MSLSRELFPAAATNSMFASFAALTSSRSAWENPAPLQLFDRTRMSAPPDAANACLAPIANSMPLIASAIEPPPSALRNLMPMIRVVQFTPATPSWLLPTAPMVPATCVPWLWSSIGSQVRRMALKPWVPAAQVTGTPPTLTVNAAGAVQMLAARSSCV